MLKRRHFVAALHSRWLFAIACGLLALQLLLLCYSYSDQARSILWLDGKRKHDDFGVANAQWVVFHMADSPVTTGPPRRYDFAGARYVAMPGVCFFVVIHMAWTIVPTGVIVGLGGKQRLGNWWAGRRSARRRREGLCAVCGYDIRASRQQCPECGNHTFAEGIHAID
jgi:hypothetical protein